ncbi:hypothetical protein KIW84_044024 [Lathyrus oleraceus]|uniref:CCHC-type domain-containing protein n=1 Tax=Pisum sativum TaxID=3888 RepID=A0A9D4XJJ4_PEA|nr:hypothetical protein KIW84_044024 [Pisum sativum]
MIAYDGQNTVVSLLVIRLDGPMLYEFNKDVPYKYNAILVEDCKEVHIPAFQSVMNIADNVDQDEVLKLIKKSDLNVVDQLLHTPSKIFVLSLLMSLKAHREALQKVLEHAYVNHDVTINQFDGNMANIIACNNLSFSDEEFPEQGKNNNLALHISMNCHEDAMSNVMVDTSSSLSVLPKCTLSKISYQGAMMRFSGVIVKWLKEDYNNEFQKRSRTEEISNQGKGIQCHGCEGFGHIREECTTYLKKQKRGCLSLGLMMITIKVNLRMKLINM